MEVSLDTVLSLLSKWKSESTPIRFAASVGFVMSFTGVISQFNSNAILLQNQIKPDDYVIVPLRIARAFDYTDAREAPPGTDERTKEQVASMLMLVSGDGSSIALVELKQAA